jgi:ubiquinone/menaquinone biosynthesis C-methylase UbiE
MKELYDSLAWSYDLRQENPWTRRMREAEKPFLNLAGGRVLDVGCGTGHHLKMFPGAIGIDVSEKMLKEARKHGRVVKARAEALPFEDESFDTILCMFTVLNLCGWKKAVKEMARVLRPGGVCIATVASVYDRGWSYRERRAARNPPGEKMSRIHGQKVVLRLFPKEELEREFRENGLLLERFKGLFILAGPKWGDFAPLTLKERLLLGLERFFPGGYGSVYLFAFRKPEKRVSTP